MPSTDSTLIQGGLLCCALYYLSIPQIAGEGNILTKLYEISEHNLLSSWINAKLQLVPEIAICLAGNCSAGCSPADMTGASLHVCCGVSMLNFI